MPSDGLEGYTTLLKGYISKANVSLDYLLNDVTQPSERRLSEAVGEVDRCHDTYVLL